MGFFLLLAILGLVALFNRVRPVPDYDPPQWPFK